MATRAQLESLRRKALLCTLQKQGKMSGNDGHGGDDKGVPQIEVTSGMIAVPLERRSACLLATGHSHPKQLWALDRLVCTTEDRSGSRGACGPVSPFESFALACAFWGMGFRAILAQAKDPRRAQWCQLSRADHRRNSPRF